MYCAAPRGASLAWGGPALRLVYNLRLFAISTSGFELHIGFVQGLTRLTQLMENT